MPPVEHRAQLPCDRQFQRHAGLGLLDPENPALDVHALPAQRQHLVEPHAGIEAEPERIPGHRAGHLGLDARAPAGKHLGRSGNLAPLLAMILAAAGKPPVDRIAQSLPIDTGPAVDRAQQRYRLIGRRPAMVRGNAVEPVLDIPASDGVERPRQPVVETEPNDLAVELDGPGRAIGVGRHVVLEGIRQEGHGPGAGTLPGRVAAAGDRAEHLLGHLARPFRRDLAVAAQDDALVGRFPAAAGAVADDEGLDARGLDAYPEAGQPVVPGDPGPVARLRGRRRRAWSG